MLLREDILTLPTGRLFHFFSSSDPIFHIERQGGLIQGGEGGDGTGGGGGAGG